MFFHLKWSFEIDLLFTPLNGITPNDWPINKNGQIASRKCPSKQSFLAENLFSNLIVKCEIFFFLPWGSLSTDGDIPFLKNACDVQQLYFCVKALNLHIHWTSRVEFLHSYFKNVRFDQFFRIAMPWNSSDFRLVFSKFKIIFKRNKNLVGMHTFNPFIQQK